MGNADILEKEAHGLLHGEQWQPTQLSSNNVLRVPIDGTLEALKTRHQAFLRRIDERGFLPQDAFTQFKKIAYCRSGDSPNRPFVVFELMTDQGKLSTYPQRKLMKMAGMVRHLAINAMRKTPPPGCDAAWVEQYVAGHVGVEKGSHRQFSYVPLLTVGHGHGDQLIRRVLITCPAANVAWLNHLASQLNGERLAPENQCEFEEGKIPRLLRISGDAVTRCYTHASKIWHSVTPVILPGHDDHKRAKTRKLIQRALTDSGIVEPCEFEWSAVSRFPKSFSAHKTDRRKQPAGYLRPDHLLSQTAVHLTLRFQETKPAGPLILGAGRHYGFGIMANALSE